MSVFFYILDLNSCKFYKKKLQIHLILPKMFILKGQAMHRCIMYINKYDKTIRHNLVKTWSSVFLSGFVKVYIQEHLKILIGFL